MLSDFDKSVVRAWSAVVSRGMLGSAREVAAYMGNGVALDDVIVRLNVLRARHQLPPATLLGPVAS